MTPEVFMEGQVFTVEVKDCRRDAAEKEKADSEIYSKVTEIASVQPRPNPESINQESRIKNHPIKQSTNQVWPVR
jgi:hypothetical protein